MNNKRTYKENVHRTGRLWMAVGVVFMFSVPITVSIVYGAWPNLQSFLKGSLSVILIFLIGGAVEAFSYMPMLGTGGSYLAFITGNISNLKLPCSLNAMKSAGVQPGSEEGEVISTIAIGVSSIVTTLVVSAFLLMFLLSDVQSVLQLDSLQPAFDNLLPALLGGYSVMIVAKYIKMSIAPLLIMAALYIALPSLSGAMGVLVPLGILISVISARIFYKAENAGR